MCSPATVSKGRNNVDSAIVTVVTVLSNPNVTGVLKCMLLV